MYFMCMFLFAYISITFLVKIVIYLDFTVIPVSIFLLFFPRTLWKIDFFLEEILPLLRIYTNMYALIKWIISEFKISNKAIFISFISFIEDLVKTGFLEFYVSKR